jgi:hypothetical protein
MKIEPTKLNLFPELHSQAQKTSEAEQSLPLYKGEEVKLSKKARQVAGKKDKPAEKKEIVVSGPAPKLPMEKTKWTVLVYNAADNDLGKDIAKSVASMEQVGSSKDMNVVVQIDRGPKPNMTVGGDKNASRYYIMKDRDSKHINSPSLENLGPVNSSSPAVLKDFLAWGMKNFPAEHYMVILNDHGAGFLGALEDDTENGFMHLPEMAKALTSAENETGVTKDKVLIGYDACLMSQAEVAYELKDAGSVLFSSEEVIGGKGWPYKEILNANQEEKGKVPASLQDFAKSIVAESAKKSDSVFTLSAVDLTKIEEVKSAVDNFALTILKTDTDEALIRKNIETSQHYTQGLEERPYSDMHDIYDIAKKIHGDTEIKDKKLKAAAEGVMTAVKDVVITDEHAKGYEDSHGLSIYAPTSNVKSNIIKKYDALAWAQDTSWGEVITMYTGKPEPATKSDHNKPAFFNKEHLKLSDSNEQ